MQPNKFDVHRTQYYHWKCMYVHLEPTTQMSVMYSTMLFLNLDLILVSTSCWVIYFGICCFNVQTFTPASLQLDQSNIGANSLSSANIGIFVYSGFKYIYESIFFCLANIAIYLLSSLSFLTFSISHFSLASLLSFFIFVILFLYSYFLTHCSYHHTISPFFFRKESLFSSLLSLYISIYRLPFPCLSTSHYLSLGLSTSSTLTRRKNNKINLKDSVSVTISEPGSFSDFVILFSFNAGERGSLRGKKKVIICDIDFQNPTNSSLYSCHP